MLQLYPWFKFYFPLFQTHYSTLPYPKTKGNKFKPRIKLNHKIYLASFWRKFISDLIQLCQLVMFLSSIGVREKFCWGG